MKREPEKSLALPFFGNNAPVPKAVLVKTAPRRAGRRTKEVGTNCACNK